MCLVDILKSAKSQLRQQILDILADDIKSPQELAWLLRGAYTEATCIFSTLRGVTDPVDTLANNTRGSVIITSSSGQLSLRYHPEQGWTSAFLGLHRSHLATYLSEWPAFHIPTSDASAALNDTLCELRELLAGESKVDVTRVAELAESHVSPLVHDYIDRHRRDWSEDRVWDLERRQRRRFAELGLNLLRNQSTETLQQVLDAHEGDTDADTLAVDLQLAIGPMRGRWSEVLGFEVDCNATRENAGLVRVGGETWETEEMEVFFRYDQATSTWRPTPPHAGLHEALSSILELLQTDASPTLDNLAEEYTWFEDRYGSYDADDSLAIAESAILELYCLQRHPEVLQQLSDEELLEKEEDWKVQMYFQGIGRGQQDA